MVGNQTQLLPHFFLSFLQSQQTDNCVTSKHVKIPQPLHTVEFVECSTTNFCGTSKQNNNLVAKSDIKGLNENNTSLYPCKKTSKRTEISYLRML